ncbi:MAG: DUF2723 domain-containing protein [Bacteroidota bacterium]
MTHKVEHRIVAAGVFVISALIYLITMAPTVVFWDVGEFIAAAWMLQVPHPPGSPFFLLVTRVAMMFPTAADLAVRAHAFTALCSASGVMFMYLVMVRVIMNFRGTPNSFFDKLVVYGASAIGTLSMGFATTYWGNSIESEVYGLSMFFLTSVLWLALRWVDRDGSPGHEKYILMIAYLIGLSLGVHLLALLAIFPILMIIYFKRYEINFSTFIKFGLVTVAVFFVVYPGIVKYVPGMMDGDFGGTKSDAISYIPWLIIAGVMYGAYTSYQKRQKMLHIALLSVALIFIGYTTYTSVLIRSNANPPMNENNPNNLARLTSYLGREQYGDSPLWPRRYSQEPHQQGIYANYTSEMDFLVRYQLNHMFTRYMLWNYAGSEGDWQDARANLFPLNGVLNTIVKFVSNVEPFAGEGKDSLLCIPLLVGLFGMWQHFKKDWKMAWVFLAMFIIMGPVLALYQAQQEPQPRERDYFYVGAYLVFSLWIAIGIVAIIDMVKKSIHSPQMGNLYGMAFLGLFTLTIPANMLRVNWESHDRAGNYVAWDYSYNILQTCEKNAILFTNGDNDTFPLWYLQDVEGIRRDVRIVNLSLINTPWYIKQMKDKPYYSEANAVPISLSDAQIERIGPSQWEPRNMELPVPKEAFERYGVKDTALTNKGKIDFVMNNTFQSGNIKAIKVQDILVRDIIFTNNWKYPVYFAVTVAPDSKIGLDGYLWFHGLAQRLEPRMAVDNERGLDPVIVEHNLLQEPDGFSKEPQYGYKFRGVADPGVYFDENTTRLMVNYRSAFIRLALFHANVAKNNDKASATLDKMEQVIPRAKIPMGWELTADLASFYKNIDRMDKFNELAEEVEPVALQLIETGQFNMSSYRNPFRVLLEIYETRKEKAKQLDLLKKLAIQFPKDPSLQQRIQMLEAEVKAETPSQQGAVDTAS